MSKDYSLIPLGEAIEYRSEFIEIDDFQTYKRCRVQLHAQGIVERDAIPGAEIKTKRQQVCRANEFLVAEIDAKLGGFGIVPDSLEGAIVSSHYFLFTINESLLNRRFLEFFIRTPAFIDQVQAKGSTNYAAIRPNDVLKYEIPLPPLEEQYRIVARIEELVAKIEEARGLRREVVEETEVLIDSMLREILANNESNSEWEQGPIPNFAEVNPPRKIAEDFSMQTLVSFVPMKALDEKTGQITDPEIKPFLEVSKGHTMFMNGDVIFARITPCMQNGKVAFAQNLGNGIGFGSTEFHVLRPGPKILGRWLHLLARHRDFRDDAEAHMKGTAGQQRVPQSFLEQKQILVPSLSEQESIITYLEQLQAKVDTMEHKQAKTSVELDALLPSVLDKAFKGELL